MRRKWNKGALTLTMALTLIGITACGNQPSADVLDNESEIEESTIETEIEEETAENESFESEETEPIEIASGHQHNIDMEEKIKEIDTEEEVLEAMLTT